MKTNSTHNHNTLTTGFVALLLSLLAPTTLAGPYPGIEYDVHVAGFGWMGWFPWGEDAGTVGQGRRMEGIKIRKQANSRLPASCSIRYQPHVAKLGWLGWSNEGQVAGTTGQSRALEALKISLVGAEKCEGWRLCAQAHVQDKGWKDSNVGYSISVGTTGSGKRMEAINIALVPPETPSADSCHFGR